MLWPIFLWFIRIWDVFNVGSKDYQWNWGATDKSSRRRGLFNGKYCALKLFDTKFSPSRCLRTNHWDGLFFITTSTKLHFRDAKKARQFHIIESPHKDNSLTLNIPLFFSEKWTHLIYSHKFFNSFFLITVLGPWLLKFTQLLERFTRFHAHNFISEWQITTALHHCITMK